MSNLSNWANTRVNSILALRGSLILSTDNGSSQVILNGDNEEELITLAHTIETVLQAYKLEKYQQ